MVNEIEKEIHIMANAKEKKQAEEQAARAVSLCPDDMQEGGGLLDNIVITVKSAQFVVTDYGGKSKIKRPAAHLVLTEMVNGEEYDHDDQFWSCGKMEDWVPSDDGKYLIPTGVKTQIHKSSNFGMLMASLMDNGWPKDKFDADIGFLTGAKFHMMQTASGRPDTEKDGKTYKDTVLCVAEILQYPWEEGKKSGGGGGKKTAKKAPSKSAHKTQDEDSGSGSGDDDLDADLAAIVLQLAIEAGEDGITKKALASKISAARKGEDQKVTNKMLAIVFKPGFLESEDAPWDFDGTTVTMAG